MTQLEELLAEYIELKMCAEPGGALMVNLSCRCSVEINGIGPAFWYRGVPHCDHLWRNGEISLSTLQKFMDDLLEEELVAWNYIGSRGP